MKTERQPCVLHPPPSASLFLLLGILWSKWRTDVTRDQDALPTPPPPPPPPPPPSPSLLLSPSVFNFFMVSVSYSSSSSSPSGFPFSISHQYKRCVQVDEILALYFVTFLDSIAPSCFHNYSMTFYHFCLKFGMIYCRRLLVIECAKTWRNRRWLIVTVASETPNNGIV